MPPNYILLHNIIFGDAMKPEDGLGALQQNGVISEANFLDILEIVHYIHSLITSKERISRNFLWRCNVHRQLGVYHIHSRSI